MIRKTNIAALVALFLALGVSIFAQSAPVTGRVMLKKANGDTVPLAGATVQPIQVEIKASSPSDKTDKKGQFNFAGLKLGATYVLSVSGPGAAPRYVPNVKAGNENIVITLDEGDGSSYSADEIRAAIARGSSGGAAAAASTSADSKASGELTAEQKKAQAEYLAKKAEIEGKNAKALKANEIVNKALTDGNAAYTAKNYDQAITSYDEGIAADPDFAGSAPVLLNNKATALTARAVASYNANVKTTDATAKIEAFNKIKSDFAAAIDSYEKSLKVLAAVTPADGVDPKSVETNKLNAVRGAKDTFRLMAATQQVDETKLPLAKAMIPQYVALETDAAKKEEAKLVLADVFRVGGDSEGAISAYRSVLETSPDNVDAMGGLGFSLVNVGYANNDKAAMQEGANLLQKFAASAPDTNKYKADALALIETLKTEQNVAPVKSAGTKATVKKKG